VNRDGWHTDAFSAVTSVGRRHRRRPVERRPDD